MLKKRCAKKSKANFGGLTLVRRVAMAAICFGLSGAFCMAQSDIVQSREAIREPIPKERVEKVVEPSSAISSEKGAKAGEEVVAKEKASSDKKVEDNESQDQTKDNKANLHLPKGSSNDFVYVSRALNIFVLGLVFLIVNLFVRSLNSKYSRAKKVDM